MKDNHISNPTKQETSLLKSYSKRNFVASFKADPELWSRFKAECKLRGTTTCAVLEALMEAWIEGQKVEATLIRPVTINLVTQHIVERPRRKTPSFLLEQKYDNQTVLAEKFGACHRLNPNGSFLGRIGWCYWLKRWLMGFECEECVHRR